MLDLFMEYGANVEIKNNQGFTALTLAAKLGKNNVKRPFQ